MNRQIICCVLALLSCIVMVGATSEDIILDTPNEKLQSPANPTTNVGATIDTLIIDTAGVYEGMKMSYDSGYKPDIYDDTVHIILPLIINRSSGVSKLADNMIKIIPNLGTATNSPFIFEGVHMQQISIIGESTSVADEIGLAYYYLLKLPIKLKEKREEGVHAISLSIEYQVEGNESSQTQEVIFNVPVNAKGIEVSISPEPTENAEEPPQIIEGADNSGDISGTSGGGGSASGSGGGSSASNSKARLMLDEYSLSSNPVLAGDEFELTAKIKNTSTKASINNLIITFAGESADIIVAGNSNTEFVKSIKANASKDVAISMKVRADAEAKPQKVTLFISGEDKDGTEIEETMDILVDIRQPDRIEFDEPSIAESINAGDTIPVTLKIMNKGKGTLNNVSCTLDAPGMFAEGTAFLGNMESGTSKDAELMAFVGTLDMSSAKSDDKETASDSISAEKYGPVEGKLIITYEDNYGNEYTEEIAINTVINEPIINEPEVVEEEELETVGQWWVSVLISTGLIIILCIAILVAKKRRLDRITIEDEAF